MFNSLGSNLSILIAALVAIPFLVVAAVFVIGAMRGRRRVSVAHHWPTTSGKVTYSTVDASRTYHSGGTHGTVYYPRVTYEYKVNGQPYQSSQISLGSAIGISDYNGVVRKAATYPINSTVTVYYNPDNPSEAVLELSSPASNLYLIIGVIIFVILSFTLITTIGGTAFMSNWVNSLLSGFHIK